MFNVYKRNAFPFSAQLCGFCCIAAMIHDAIAFTTMTLQVIVHSRHPGPSLWAVEFESDVTILDRDREFRVMMVNGAFDHVA